MTFVICFNDDVYAKIYDLFKKWSKTCVLQFLMCHEINEDDQSVIMVVLLRFNPLSLNESRVQFWENNTSKLTEHSISTTDS